MKKILSAAIGAMFVAGGAQAASFTNGGFENGTTSGWTTGGGVWNSSIHPLGLPLDPNLYLSGGARYNPNGTTFGGPNASFVVTSAGTDAITGASTVKYGDHSVRVNDSFNNYGVSVMQQKVTNYDGTSINFAWNAVLEGSHGTTDSDNFQITLVDNTTGATVYSVAYSSATTPGSFRQVGNWFTSDWVELSIAVTQGHDFTLTLLAADCPYSGHAGYVYLDGFGTVSGGGGDDNAVPEPGSLALAGLALAGLAGLRRKRQA